MELAEYPYILKTGSLRNFLQNMPSLAVPEKVTLEYLYSIGYKSTNDRPIVKILKFINFLNPDGTPNENYKKFRVKEQSRPVMAECLRSVYAELFKTYTDAHNRSKEALKDFFAAKTTKGKEVIEGMVDTFKVLCEFADFEAPKIPPEEEGKEEGVEKKEYPLPGLVINLNIQLALPATEDASVYDKIFESLRKHLLIRD